MTKEEFLALPCVASFFPMIFDSGARWLSFVAQCGKCEDQMGIEDTRGSVEPMFAGGSYRDVPRVIAYHVVAESLCPRCQLLTTTDCVLHENMTITGKSPRTGLDSLWGTVKPGWLQSTRNYFSKFFISAIWPA